MSEMKQGFIVETPEGHKVFETRSEAKDFMRTPVVLKALTKLAKDADTASWLLANKETILGAFEGGKIKRVTKSERKALEKALDQVTSGFLFDNSEAILDSFRWPSVKRLTAEEQAAEVQLQLMGVTEDDEKMVQWLKDNKDALSDAYDAGIEKREVSSKATDALAAYRAMTPEQKAEAAAAKAKAAAEAAKAKAAAK